MHTNVICQVAGEVKEIHTISEGTEDKRALRDFIRINFYYTCKEKGIDLDTISFGVENFNDFQEEKDSRRLAQYA